MRYVYGTLFIIVLVIEAAWENACRLGRSFSATLAVKR
jgi:hypothetical protein